VAGVAVLFGLAAAFIVMKVRSGLNAQAPLFSSTLAELRNDVAYLRGQAVAATAHAHAGGVDD